MLYSMLIPAEPTLAHFSPARLPPAAVPLCRLHSVQFSSVNVFMYEFYEQPAASFLPLCPGTGSPASLLSTRPWCQSRGLGSVGAICLPNLARTAQARRTAGPGYLVLPALAGLANYRSGPDQWVRPTLNTGKSPPPPALARAGMAFAAAQHDHTLPQGSVAPLPPHLPYLPRSGHPPEAAQLDSPNHH